MFTLYYNTAIWNKKDNFKPQASQDIKNRNIGIVATSFVASIENIVLKYYSQDIHSLSTKWIVSSVYGNILYLI